LSSDITEQVFQGTLDIQNGVQRAVPRVAAVAFEGQISLCVANGLKTQEPTDVAEFWGTGLAPEDQIVWVQPVSDTLMMPRYIALFKELGAFVMGCQEHACFRSRH
jgi:hypothetical protein